MNVVLDRINPKAVLSVLLLLFGAMPAMAQDADPVLEIPAASQSPLKGFSAGVGVGAHSQAYLDWNFFAAYRLPVLDNSLELIGDYNFYASTGVTRFYQGAYLGLRWYFFNQPRYRLFAQAGLGLTIDSPGSGSAGSEGTTQSAQLPQALHFGGMGSLGFEFNLYQGYWAYLRYSGTSGPVYSMLNPELGLKFEF